MASSHARHARHARPENRTTRNPRTARHAKEPQRKEPRHARPERPRTARLAQVEAPTPRRAHARPERTRTESTRTRSSRKRRSRRTRRTLPSLRLPRLLWQTKPTNRQTPKHSRYGTVHPTPRQRQVQREQLRRNRHKLNRSYAIRSLMRSPAFAYAAGAIVLTLLVFVLTIPTVPQSAEPAQSGPGVADKPKLQPENDEYVEPREIAHEFEGNCANAVHNSNAYGVLTRAIGEFEDTGDAVSFAVRDLSSGNELFYDSGRVQYPASSIKAPYTASVYQLLVEPGEANIEEVYPLAQDTIVESSDDSYHWLREQYGDDVFQRWLVDAGVGHDGYESLEEMMRWNYPHMCSNQLLLMWVHMYDYLQSDTGPAHQLADLLTLRTTSAMREALGPEVRTWGKMGWFEYEGDYGSEPATVEGGVVFAEEGPYAVAVMTTAPAQIGELEPIFTAIARAHYDML